MRCALITLFLLFSSPILAEPVMLTVEEWARPRSGEMLTSHPVLARIVKAFSRRSDGAAIVIAHSTSEADQLWAEELRSWFVALGVSSSHIRFESRPELQEMLILDVHEVAGL